MKKLTFEEMLFSRTSSAWCPITGKAVGNDTPRVVEDRILASVGSAPVYYRFDASQGYVKYSNEVGCYDRAGSTHVFTDELDAMALRLAGIADFDRTAVGDGLSQDGRPLECFSVGNIGIFNQVFLITTLIHGNEPDGILGTLKAFETLVTHPDFAPLRDLYSLCLLPCCNPDGYYLGQRNLNLLGPHPSGTDTGINLNRVWPWYWTEFVPTDGESKGDAPITCSLESQAMEHWRKPPGWDGPSRPIAWALDQHSTAGDGARYVSRDRNFRDLPEGDYEKFWADWTSYRLLKAIQAKRVHEDAMPDLFVNYYRSRWRPHWHSYLATLQTSDNGGIQCCSFVGEHNKVPNQVISSDLETYQSASNYNFDHIIALALVAQGGITERKRAVLIEHEVGDNQFQNSDFEAWQPDEYRPSYWSASRADYVGLRPDPDYETEKHMQARGRTLQLTPSLTVELEDGYYDDNGGADMVWAHGSSSLVFIAARTDAELNGLGVWTWDLSGNPQLFITGDPGTAEHTQWRIGKATLATPVYVFGTGNLTTPYPAELNTYTLNLGVWETTTVASHTTPLVDAAVCTERTTGNLYVFGGETGSGLSPKVFKADCTANTFTEVGTDLLGDGEYGMGSSYCEGGDLDGLIALIGDDSDGELGLHVRIFNPSTGALTLYNVSAGDFDLYEPLKPASIMHCAVVYDGVDTLWFYGGEHPTSGDVYRSVWSITWNGTGFDSVVSHLLDAGLSDDGDPEDYAGDEDWIRRFRYWRGLRIEATEDTALSHMLFGGLERLGEGGDESDVANKKGFYGHYFADNLMARPSEYTYAYMRYNTHFDVTTFSKMNTSWSMRSVDDGVTTLSSAYIRINNSTGDSAALNTSVRRLRTYYMHPPQWWIREHSAVDFSTAKPSTVEDEVRCYIRGYRQGQTFMADAPMMQKGTLWPSSWSPYGLTRATEMALWPMAIDGRFFRVKFDWLPSSIFYALQNDTQLLITLGIDETQYIQLYATTANQPTAREYVRGYLNGPTEPVLELRKYDGGEGYAACSIPIYWGGHLKDTAAGRFDSPVQIEIWHHPMYGAGLVVRNGWAEGWARIPTRFLPSAWPASGEVLIHGGGWWGEPETLEMDAAWKRQAVRPDFTQGALLLGDRDPTYGQVSARGVFRYTENFTRADDINLGDYWDVIAQTGNGFNIFSNQARCEQRGIERWDAYPYVRDCSVIASVSAPNGNKVGLCTRLHWGMGTDGWVHGYVGYLSCTGASTANLVIERHYYNAGVQAATNLASVPITYTAGSTVTLTLAASSSDITLTVSDGATGTATASDSNHLTPGAFGIYGETTGAGSYVYIDSVSAIIDGGTLTRITE